MYAGFLGSCLSPLVLTSSQYIGFLVLYFSSNSSKHWYVVHSCVTITPKHKFNQALLDYNIYIRDSLITKYLTRGHSISSIDLYQHFLINKEDPRSIDENLLSNGINHPTNQIYDKIALTWFNEIKRLLTKEKVQ